MEDNKSVKRSLLYALLLCFAFMLVEGIGGVFAGSLAMIGDAAHMLTDAASFGVSLAAVYLAERGATAKMTYGLARFEVLAALASTLGIWLVTGMLVLESLRRMELYSKGLAEPVDGRVMTFLGLFGLLNNIILERVLGGHSHGGHSHGHSHGHGCSHGAKPAKDEGHDHGSHGHGAHDHAAHAHEDHGHAETEHAGCCGDHEHGGHDHAAPAAAPAHGHAHGHSSKTESSHAHDSAKEPDVESNGHDHAHAAKSKKLKESSSLLKTTADGYSAVASEDGGQEQPKPKRRSLNLDAAYLHVLGDIIQSLAVVVAGIIIWVKPEWQIADSICTLLFAVLVLLTTAQFLQSTITVLLEGAPADVDVPGITRKLGEIDGVSDVHDVHVWEISPGRPILTAHLKLDSDTPRATNDVLREAHALCQAAGIDHATIQLQDAADSCVAKNCCAAIEMQANLV